MKDFQSNSNTDFCPISVADLLNGEYIFVIPSYQRGYRWEKKQVVDLLEDIYEFSKSNQESYYLQPLVVKPCKWKDDNGNERNAWEVLDGQQRLTTLRLILLYMFKEGLMPYEKETYTTQNIYDIVYTNRPKLNFDNPESKNIDGYYLNTAKKTIEQWFKNHVSNGIMQSFKECLMYNKLVKFIWYEVPKDKQTIESIQVFNRLNKGKISLTSSELIKALFIMDSNIISEYDKTKADELVLDLNQMERQFQNDKFWAFLSNDNGDYQTRIDVLFDFLTEKPKDNEDKDYAYRKFQNLYDYSRSKELKNNSVTLDELWSDKNIQSMQDAWKEVVWTYDRLVAWFEDNMYYHYVGFLVSMGNQPREIYKYLSELKAKDDSKEWTLNDTKKAFYKKMMDCFKEKDKYLTVESIDGLEYGSDFIFRVLLLFNVESCMKKGQRFDFYSFKKEQWDIEHINSQNNASLIERDDRIRWLNNVKFILEIESKLTERKNVAEKLLKECTNLIERYEKSDRGIENDYKDFSQKAMEYFSSDNKLENNDNISNLTLLDYRTNREYKDAPFPYKRYRIIEEDKEGKRFIPVGTRNVFLKYYTNSNIESSFIDALRWTKTDAECYLEEIHKVVDTIFNIVNENKAENHE